MGTARRTSPPASPPGLQGGQATPGELQATNRRDLCLVPGEQGRRPLGPPPRAHLPPPPAGPSRPGQGVRLLGGAHSPPGPSVHSGQGPCPLVLGSQPDRQMGLAGRGKSKTPPSWAPHHPGCGSELAVPRGPRRPGRTCPGRKEGLCPECGQLQAGASSGFWGRKGAPSGAGLQGLCQASRGLPGPRPRAAQPRRSSYTELEAGDTVASATASMFFDFTKMCNEL